jgi:hypothetical protein
MIRSIGATAILLLLVGCVGYVPTQPVYYQPAPVYVQPRPVYVQPRPVYIQPPRCGWVSRWNGYTRRYENIKVCR